jgi:hypothetical protein
MTPREDKMQTFKKSPVRKPHFAQVQKGSIFHPDYLHTDYLEYWLRDFIRGRSCLNVCCGWSDIGDVRVDNSPDSNRTMDGDVFNMLAPGGPFRENQYDIVYCDPPFRLFTAGDNRFRWQFDLMKIAKYALITRRTKVAVNMPSRYHEYIIAEDSRPSITLLRIDYK